MQLKYRPNQALARTMAGWLAAVCRRSGWPATMIVPVPLGQRRLRQRGFNQAALLARPLGRRLGLPVDPTALARQRETRSQVGLGFEERQANVEGAFGGRRPAVAGEAVIVVDDLCTTGATLSACARALRAAGAARTFGLTVGRAG